ncbi:MAG: sulfite exporter TauE/SafE family protein [Tepidisphaeraceae bacterium]
MVPRMWWALVFAAVILIGITKSGFGSGVGLMIVPIAAIALDHVPGRSAEMALGLLLPLLIFGDFLAVWQYRNLFFGGPARQVLLRLLPGTAVGVALGGGLLWLAQHQANLVGALMRIEIGIESISLVSLHWWQQWRGARRHLLPEPWRSHLTGGFAAVSSTLAHAAGPIIAMYLLPLKLDRQLYVGTCAVYFFILNTAKLPAYWASGQFGHFEPAFTLKLLPLVLAGAIFGKWINRRLNDQLFTKIVYAVTFALGWYILADGILSLYGKHIA